MEQIEGTTKALQLLRVLIDAVPTERRDIVAKTVAGYMLGADVPAEHVAKALIYLREKELNKCGKAPQIT